MNYINDILLESYIPVVLDYEKDFFSVFEETASVVHWYTLGLYLRMMPSELERINLECHFNYEGLAQMLSVWLKTGHATWLTLVRALSKIGQNNLAIKIANKKGKCLCTHANISVMLYARYQYQCSDSSIPDLITKEFLWI